jgi:hypothetical protein
MWPIVLRAAALALIAVAAVYVVIQGTRPSDMELLQAQPVNSLYYPGSVVLRQGGHEPAFMQPTAYTWRELGVDATADEVIAFYDAEMKERGWVVGGGGHVIAADAQACGWHTADLILTVAFRDVGNYAKAHPADAGYATIYELRLWDDGTTYGGPECNPGE